MPHVTPQQTRKLGTHALSRGGITVPGAHAMTAAACWNFALTGTVLGMANPNSPAEIYEGAAGILDINNFVIPPVVNGLRPTATVINYPGCAAELAVLNGQIGNAILGNVLAQNACQEALVKIVARRNGLIPIVGNNRYQLHMKATTWFGWDHWGLSFRAEQPGRPRIYVQTTTGTLLKHACNTMWDEHLQGVTVNLQELNLNQVNFINMVNTYGNLCVVCGVQHGRFPSSVFNAWHRCAACGAVYCPRHGKALTGNRGWKDRTRDCGQPGCIGRTVMWHRGGRSI